MATIIPELYRKKRAEYFEEKTRTDTVVSKIADIHEAEFNDKITQANRSDAVVTKVTTAGKLTEVDIQDYTTSKEEVVVDTALVTAEPSEFVKNAYSIVDLEKASMDDATQSLLVEFDKEVLTEAVAQATTVTATTDITDDATATQFALEVNSALAGYAVKAEDIVLVIDNTMLVHFLKAGATRQTEFGDNVVKTGSLFTFYGMTLYVVRAGQLPAGEVLASIRGAIDVYLDKLQFTKRQQNATAATKVSLVDININLAYYAVKIWSDNLKKVVKLG